MSPQLTKYSKQIVKKSNLSYPILYDQGNTFASQMGLVFALSEDLKKLYTSFGIDLVRFNGDETWQLPMPARFIINTKGEIIDSEVNPDYTQRPEPTEILTILQNQ